MILAVEEVDFVIVVVVIVVIVVVVLAGGILMVDRLSRNWNWNCWERVVCEHGARW